MLRLAGAAGHHRGVAKLAGADVMVQRSSRSDGAGVLTMCDGVDVVAASTLVAAWRCDRRNAARGLDARHSQPDPGPCFLRDRILFTATNVRAITAAAGHWHSGPA